jgi:ribosomal protection tetracycline resistance protein
MSSTAGDFRNLTPLVVMDALQQASTCVYEPIHRFHVQLPAYAVATALRGLAELQAVPQAPSVRGSTAVLDGDIPAARVHELQQRLTMTRGEGVADTEFDHYAPVGGVIASRPRSDHNPLNRREYLLHVVRRVAAAVSDLLPQATTIRDRR